MLDPKTIKSIVKAELKLRKEEVEVWDRWAQLYRCQNWGPNTATSMSGDDDLVVENGAMFAYIDNMISSVVPPNPRTRARRRETRSATRTRSGGSTTRARTRRSSTRRSGSTRRSARTRSGAPSAVLARTARREKLRRTSVRT